MKFICDPRFNIAYLSFREKVENVDTIKISDELNLDLAPDGKIYGIELLNANEQIMRKGLNFIEVINEATGEKKELTFENF